jgi:uncharacterized membrane-anchored protein
MNNTNMNNVNTNMNSDNISKLPVKKEIPNFMHPHLKEFFQNVQETDNNSFSFEIKEFVAMIVIFAILSSNVLDKVFINNVSVCKSPISLTVVKSTIFAVIYYIIHNSNIMTK